MASQAAHLEARSSHVGYPEQEPPLAAAAERKEHEAKSRADGGVNHG